MGEFDEKNSAGMPGKFFTSEVLSNRLFDGDRLIRIDKAVNETCKNVNKALDDILYEQSSYDLGEGRTVTISGKDDFVAFAKGVQGRPFYELDRHPGTHFKVYALSQGITAEDLLKITEEPDSEESLSIVNRLRNLREGFIRMTGKPDLEGCQDMYVDFSKAVYDNYLEDILSCTVRLDNLEKNAKLCGVLGGEYSYIAQTLKYHADEPSRDSESTRAFIQGINDKLSERNSGYAFECMTNLLQLVESIGQSKLDIAGDVMKNSTINSPIARSNNYIALLTSFVRFNQLFENKPPKEFFPQMTFDFTHESNFIGELVKFDNKIKFSSLPDNFKKYYLHEGETVSDDYIKETYMIYDSEFNIHTLTQEEYDTYKETNVLPKVPVNQPIKTNYKKDYSAGTGLDKIAEASRVEDDIFANYPVRDYVEPKLLPYPEPAEIEITDSTDLELFYATKDFNKLIAKKDDTLWVLKNLEEILYSGVTYAPDPEQPNQTITVLGKKECHEFFDAFKKKPFNELGRPGVESAHLLAFCAVEGIDFNDIRDMLLNPEKETSLETRERIEDAKIKLFEAGCCIDFETGMKRTEEFYVNYCKLLMDAEQEFIDSGDITKESIMDFNARFSSSQSILVQTLDITNDKPGSVCNRVETAVSEAFKAEGRNLTVNDIAKLPGRCQGLFQNIGKFNSLDPDAPVLNANYGISFQESMEYARILRGELSEYPKNADIYARNALLDGQYFQRMEDEASFALDYYDVKANPGLFARTLNRYMRDNESAALAEAELRNQLGDPADTIGTLLNELMQWDSGLLRLRGSERFKNIREAATKIEKTLKSTGREFSEEDCAALGEQFTELLEATQVYLEGKRDVDINADTNAGHRKSIADKLNTFANIGKAYFHLKEDRFIYDRNQRRYSHEAFLAENRFKAMEGENSTLCAEANKRSDKLAEFLTGLAPESTPDELPEIIDNAENGYKLFAESVRTGTTPNPSELKEAYSNIFTALLVLSEQNPDKKLEGPITGFINERGADTIVNLVSELPIVSEYVQKGNDGFKNLLKEKPFEILTGVKQSLYQKLEISVNAKAPAVENAAEIDNQKVKDSKPPVIG